MINLLDLNRQRLELKFADTPYRAGQIFSWIFGKGIREIEDMSNIPRRLREEIAGMAAITYPEVVDTQRSVDGTEKLAYRLADGHIIESVLIPEKNHWSICVSSQVGCSMGCMFCFTATMGFIRNLSLAEIITQVLNPIHAYPDRHFRNVVFMGMGEPLLNYTNIIEAIRIMTDHDGPRISRRRITVSTCGIIPAMKTLAEDTDAGLAVSLNAASDAVRSRIMPRAGKYPLSDLISAMGAYQLPNRRRITIEYVLLKGINDSIADAQQLISTLRGLKVKVNLIPLNPWPGCTLEPPDHRTVLAFEERLKDSPVAVMMRKEKGNDILAACGQLAGGRSRDTHESC